jgi:hypothetical protein
VVILYQQYVLPAKIQCGWFGKKLILHRYNLAPVSDLIDEGAHAK